MQHYLKPVTVSVLFFALLCERIVVEIHSTGSRHCRSEKYLICRRVRAFFSPEILEDGAAKEFSSLTATRPQQRETAAHSHGALALGGLELGSLSRHVVTT